MSRYLLSVKSQMVLPPMFATYYDHLDREYNPTLAQSTLRLLHTFFNISRAPIDEKDFVTWMAKFIDQANCLESANITITDYMELHNTDQLPTPANLMALTHKQIKNHHDTRNTGSNIAAFAATSSYPMALSRSSKPTLALFVCPACKTSVHCIRNCPDKDVRKQYFEQRRGQQHLTMAPPVTPSEDTSVVSLHRSLPRHQQHLVQASLRALLEAFEQGGVSNFILLQAFEHFNLGRPLLPWRFSRLGHLFPPPVFVVQHNTSQPRWPTESSALCASQCDWPACYNSPARLPDRTVSLPCLLMPLFLFSTTSQY
ncbi:BQ5605_C012g06713 [Microbotryum silenes-dioicae]|uniref:BQ5605_C012g06713 protein n=1 Tax=Microbotryum silenes-dioicae TaxID=796604 RepID=A0A2X0LVF7_9BASI|nr:BQ5605_C012g06713 [Microbotryum silenes-dioicae]